MAPNDPLHALQENGHASFMPYGPARNGNGVQIVETFGAYEAEYAAFRKSTAVLDMPHRGLLELRGSDRLTFLQGLLTNDIAGLSVGEGCRALILNRQGRIDADLTVLNDQHATVLVVDVVDVEAVAAYMEKMRFAEDVQIENRSAAYRHLALHGPLAADLIEQTGDKPVADLKALANCPLSIASQSCLLYRHDNTGSPGLHLLVPADGAAPVYGTLLDGLAWEWEDPQDADAAAKRRGRPVGWLAYNTARIEAAMPIYHIDFGPDSLPHETGPILLEQTVSFTKGCYVGQEIVARMQNLGHPKRVLVGLKCNDDRQPADGAAVYSAADQDEVVGAVTSSTISPILGGVALALAVVKWDHHTPETLLTVHAESAQVPATVTGPVV